MTHGKLIRKNRSDAYQWRIERKIRLNHTHGDEISKLRKEIAHIENALNIEPTEEFGAYHVECEGIKTETKNEIDKE